MAVIGADRGAAPTKSAPAQIELRRRSEMMDERKARADECRGCCDLERSTRRSFLTAMSVVGLDLATDVIPAWADPASERPKEGDVLVAIDGDKPDALEPKDIPRGGPPVLAWPMDPASNTIRKDSRLNKVLLLHLDPSTLVGSTKDRAAEGVVAYSAVCPHAGCEVNGWLADQQILECSCHYSHYNPREAAAVIDGPTTRSLPALPLKIVEGKLTVAKPFTGRVGIVPT
jgi:rieske iron-sulfur protein